MSKKYSIDTRQVKHIAMAIFIGCVSIYSSNTEVFNSLIGQYVSPQTFSIITMVMAYVTKKFITDSPK